VLFRSSKIILSGVFAFSVNSAVDFKDMAISLEKSTVPQRISTSCLSLKKINYLCVSISAKT